MHVIDPCQDRRKAAIDSLMNRRHGDVRGSRALAGEQQPQPRSTCVEQTTEADTENTVVSAQARFWD